MDYPGGIRAFRREANHLETDYMPTTYDGLIAYLCVEVHAGDAGPRWDRRDVWSCFFGPL